MINIEFYFILFVFMGSSAVISMLQMNILFNESLFSKMYTLPAAPTKDSDQAAHTRSLNRVFYGRSMIIQGSNVVCFSGVKLRL